MSEEKMMRLSQVARKLNVGTATIVEHLAAKGFEVANDINSKITLDQFEMLSQEFKSSLLDKQEAANLIKKIPEKPIPEKEIFVEHKEKEEVKIEKVTFNSPELKGIKVVGKIDLSPKPKQAILEQVSPQKIEQKTNDVQKVENQPSAKENKQEEIQKIEKEVPNLPIKEEVIPQDIKTKEPQENIEKAEKTVESIKQEEKPTISHTEPEEKIEKIDIDSNLIEAKAETLKGLTVIGKINLPMDRFKKKDNLVASSDDKKKTKRKRKHKARPNDREAPKQQVTSNTTTATGTNNTVNNSNANTNTTNNTNTSNNSSNTTRPANNANNTNRPAVNKTDPRKDNRRGRPEKTEISVKQVQDQIKQTLANIGGKNKNKNKRPLREKKVLEENGEEGQNDIITVTEFISANDLATLMNVSVNEVIAKCLGLGMFVSINQRLDAEAITIIADEFNFQVKFASAEEEVNVEQKEDEIEDLISRPPIVTVMGHVDHGKTSLLDYIRSTSVVAKESGGITQHIGAYNVTTEAGKKITFLDTPGHEAFTAMRARGAKVTDVVIIVVAADDNVMPQTKEAINHARLAGVPMVIAINKIDKDGANPEKIRQELSQENILVEEWGGKYQSQEISAKKGIGIADLLEKVLLEAELLDLKANPNKNAIGTVIEASLDKGRGYVTNVLVQSGTLKVGDIILAGSHYGRVKAMTDHIGKPIKIAGPSTPVQVLGLSGAPQAGDKFNAMESEREAREIANKREQILREQSLRAVRRLTLKDIGRRIALGNFKQLNLIVKGDVDGSIEALSDSLLKLSTEEIEVNIIHKGVGQISESDVNLATISDAVIVGFQVRPSVSARKLAEQEEIEIRTYSVIYDAIDEVKDAMEGMLAPTIEEVIVGNVEIREVFKISKIGTIAGCYVLDGNIKRSSKIRVLRDGIIIHTGEIDTLKRFKDDVSEVKTGYECGISIKNFNDLLEKDVIEAFEEKEIKRTL